MGRFPTYVVTMVALDLLGLSIAAGLFPPGTAAQTYAFGAIIVVAPLAAYWLVYREGFAYFRIDRLLGRTREGESEGRRDDAEPRERNRERE